MNIKQGLESNMIGVGDNYIVLENVVEYADVTFTIKGVENKTYNFCPVANDGIVEINIREIARLVYDNVQFYQDPFDYTANVLYTETDGYHFIKIDIAIVDGASSTVDINEIRVVNAALDISECLLLPALIGEVLDDNAGKTTSNFGAFNYDLSLTLH